MRQETAVFERDRLVGPDMSSKRYRVDAGRVNQKIVGRLAVALRYGVSRSERLAKGQSRGEQDRKRTAYDQANFGAQALHLDHLIDLEIR